MKNKIILFFLSLCCSLGLLAQPASQANARFASTIASETPADARAMIQQIIDVVGLTPNFEVMAARVPNAAAVIYGGKRYILYNPSFFESLTRATGSKWAAISVLAHEIGHHLDGHTLSQIGSQPQSELEADEFSGFVLRKMGATLTDAQAAMKTAAQQRATDTHPGQYDRLLAIADGWNKADAQIAGRTYVPQARVQQPATAEPQTVAMASPAASSHIIGDVRFNADTRHVYYITDQYNLVSINPDGVHTIGKMAELNSRRFPYMIYDSDNTRFFVDRYGNIVSGEGALLGKLSVR